MQVTGTIRSVFATQEGGYQGPSGYVYTFDMEIDTPQGIISGQIGSKKQPYPLAVGQPITVEVTETDRGPRLKKINPQYANQPPQGAPPQTGPPPQTPADPSSGRFATAETSTPPPQRTKQPDWDEIARGKVRCNLVCAVLQAGATLDIDYLNTLMEYIFTGRLQSAGGGANPDYGGDNPEPPPGDDIPF